MLTAQTEDLLHRLKSGNFDPADIQALERTPVQELLADLDSVYPCRFQERRLTNKWEIGAARSLRFEVFTLSSRGAFFPILVMVPVFRHCVFLSGEADTVTGISLITRLMV